MRRATTPKLIINMNVDLNNYWYRVAFAQNKDVILIKDQDDCELSDDGQTITIRFTQEETLQFNSNYKIKVQVRYGINDIVCASNIETTTIGEILDEEIIQ